MPTFEEDYEDVLQNMEAMIVKVYRQNPEMTDWDALSAVEAVLRGYNAEKKGRQPKLPAIKPPASEIHERLQGICEWRLGREQFMGESGKMDIPIEPVSLDEIAACLKRIRKSINFWTKEGGRQGYLTYIDHFIL